MKPETEPEAMPGPGPAPEAVQEPEPAQEPEAIQEPEVIKEPEAVEEPGPEPVQEPEPAAPAEEAAEAPAPLAAAAPRAELSEERSRELLQSTNFRLEMKLDLRILETEAGLELVPDPNKPLDIRVAASRGELNMLVQALEGSKDKQLHLNVGGEEPVRALDEPEGFAALEAPAPASRPAQPAGEAHRAETHRAERPAAPRPQEGHPAAGAAPSVEELLRRMNEMLRDFPGSGPSGKDVDA